jgi:hypothetical protein
MAPEEILKALRGYQRDLEQIQSRFSHSESAILIHRDDDFRLKIIVQELVDLLRDHIPGSVSHIEAITGPPLAAGSTTLARRRTRPWKIFEAS